MSSIRHRKRVKRDVWLVDYRDASGARRRLTAKSKEAAELLLADKIKEAHSPQQLAGGASELAGDPDMTLDGYATAWFLQLPSSGIKPRTMKSYQQLYDNHIKPTLGSIKIRELRRADVKAWLNAKREQVISSKRKEEKESADAGAAIAPPAPAPEPKPERKLSRNTVRLIRACL